MRIVSLISHRMRFPFVKFALWLDPVARLVLVTKFQKAVVRSFLLQSTCNY